MSEAGRGRRHGFFRPVDGAWGAAAVVADMFFTGGIATASWAGFKAWNTITALHMESKQKDQELSLLREKLEQNERQAEANAAAAMGAKTNLRPFFFVIGCGATVIFATGIFWVRRRKRMSQTTDSSLTAHADTSSDISPSDSVDQQPVLIAPNSASFRICSGRYEVQSSVEIGRGGYGVVYRGFDREGGHYVAIKESSIPSDTARGAILKEFATLQSLENEHIVKVHALHETPHSLYIVMELAQGGSLADTLKANGPLPEKLVIQYLRQTLLGLEFLHSVRLLHRDVKPGNILLFGQGSAKLADFGLSKELRGSFSMDTMHVAGTPTYLPPEAVKGHFSIGTDLWACGCAAIELLTGRPPWSELETKDPIALMFRIGTAEPGEHFPKLSPDAEVSPPLVRFLEKCFQYEARNRGTAAELRRILEGGDEQGA